MQTKWKKLISFGLAVVIAASGIPMTGMQVQAQEGDSADAQYEIYPIPREITYDPDGGTIELSDAPNLVIEKDVVDEATENRLDDILELKGIEGTASNAVVSGKTNILVGVKDSGGVVDNWFDQNITYDVDHFEQVDAYVLAIQDGVIAVLGKDTDAAFYGLSTLKLIVEQTAGRTIRKLQVNDYASGQYRGFIEGYYGIPWSVDDRISLMKFGGDFKMNIYIFAPKDDPYHNSHWREPYPEKELADIKRMVEAGAASKCRFAWAIHPFMNDPITNTTEAAYQEGLTAIKEKFQSLYDVGVRQFVISADDASSQVTLQARLCRDMTEWVKAHKGTYNLVFVPQVYCTSAVGWSSWGGSTVEQYFSYFRNIEDLEIMWTGEWVCHPASQNTMDNFKSKSGKEAFMWLNWPVNDVNHSRLVMGPAETGILEPGLNNFMGLVTNPLEQAEASKTSLFAIADFAWNTTDFSCFKSWEDGFQYIEPGAPEAMHELCKHLTNPSPGGITSMGESTELTPYITAFTSAYNNGNGTDYENEANALIEQLQKIVKAADDFQNNGVNENLQDEMKPWVDSLRYLSRACIGFIKTAVGLKNNDNAAVFGSYLSAVNNYKASQECKAPQLNNTTINVEAGAMKIMPFAATISSAVEEDAIKILGTDLGGEAPSSERKLIYGGLGGIHKGELKNITDGDDTTFTWFNNSVTKDGYIGIDLGDTYILDQIRILQGGHNEALTDYFDPTGVLEYSLDKRTWTSIGTYSDKKIEEDVLDQAIKARYVRLRTPSATGKWYAIREFSVTTQSIPTFVYTNAEEYKDIPTVIEKTEASVSETEEIVLAGGEYIGLEFPSAREITSITANYTNPDKLTLECSYNGFEWVTVEEPFQTVDAKYVRIINKGEDSVTFRLTELSVGNEEGNKTILAEPEGEPGHEAARAIDDSLLTSFAAAKGAGSLTWRMESKLADKLYILQDAETVSGAKVEIRTNTKKWISLGTLNQCQNIFEISQYGPVNEVKISWKENGPTIYEIYSESEKEYTSEETLAAAIEYAKQQTGEGYTEESFAAFKEALEAVENELKKPEITEAEAAKILAAFYQAASKLIPEETGETPDPGPGDEPGPGGKPGSGAGSGSGKNENDGKDSLKIGDTVIANNLKYRVTNANTKEVSVCGAADAKKKNKLKKVEILSTVSIKKVNCKVTGIDDKAFSGMKKLQTVIIGENVKTIGKQAFSNNKKLKKITIKSQSLTKIAKNAFKKSAGSGTIKVPKSRKKAYAKLFKKCTKMKVK